MPDPKKQGVNVVWGIPSAKQLGTGYTVEGVEHEPQAEVKELKDHDGITRTQVFNNYTDTFTADVYPSGATVGTLPELGSKVEYDGKNCIAQPGCKENWSNAGEQRMTFVLKYFPGITPT